MFGLKSYDLMYSGIKAWPWMVRYKASHVMGYFKHKKYAIEWLEANT
jgi:hypothetical protein